MKTPIEQYVIDRVREKRKQEKMSQAYLANALDVSRGFIGDIENPRKRAKYNLNHINELAIIFNCSIWELLPENPIVENK
ncbi:MAG: helix-turn-helix domain-containing protein [Rikenellaceae bacterium]|nr:helix-turn-helix domain-containing protein [Rikenellaceae bacterium]